MRKQTLRVKTADLIKSAGDVKNIASVLDITTQAVYAWGNVVPLLRVYQLQSIRPDWFRGLAK